MSSTRIADHRARLPTMPGLFILATHFNVQMTVSADANAKTDRFAAHLAIFDVCLAAH